MNSQFEAPPPSDVVLSESDFREIAQIAHAKYGLDLPLSKKALVYSRLSKRIRVLELDNFAAYCALLQGTNGQTEHAHFLSALTTNVTHFFREAHHFTFLREKLMPDLIKKAQSGQSVRLWSSACSSGQEAYCIAAVVLTACPEAADLDIRVLATDVDPKIVAQARMGTYPKEQVSAVPPHYINQLADPERLSGGSISMRAELRKIISFAELNLIGDWPMKKKFDVIFCRNVAIYFAPKTQHKLWVRLHEQLTPGGHLMIGHSERIRGPAKDKLQNVDITTYQSRTGNMPFPD
jgi:chemotaxis protein methyltransferase CheR